MSDEIDLLMDPLDHEAAAIQVMLSHKLPKKLRELGIDPDTASVEILDPIKSE